MAFSSNLCDKKQTFFSTGMMQYAAYIAITGLMSPVASWIFHFVRTGRIPLQKPVEIFLF